MKIIRIVLFSALLTNCKLTEKSVTGKWLSGSDTLFVNRDHTFLFADKKNYYITVNGAQIFDTSLVYSAGKWSVSNKILHLSFDQDKKEVFGNCSQLWNWMKFFSRYKLIRPAYCYKTSHRFVAFSKIKSP